MLPLYHHPVRFASFFCPLAARSGGLRPRGSKRDSGVELFGLCVSFARPPIPAMIPPATTAAPTKTKTFEITQLDEVPAVKCPCGFSRRAFATPDNPVATIHMVDIQTDAQTHYHKKLTEIYLILEVEGEGFMELDGQLYPVKPMTSILIKPGCRHRAVGKMKIVNIPV